MTTLNSTSLLLRHSASLRPLLIGLGVVAAAGTATAAAFAWSRRKRMSVRPALAPLPRHQEAGAAPSTSPWDPSPLGDEVDLGVFSSPSEESIVLVDEGQLEQASDERTAREVLAAADATWVGETTAEIVMTDAQLIALETNASTATLLNTESHGVDAPQGRSSRKSRPRSHDDARSASVRGASRADKSRHQQQTRSLDR